MRRTSFMGVAAFVMLLIIAGAARAHDGDAITRLRGFEEVPSISSPGGGRFEAAVDGNEVHWELSYFHLKGSVTQAHIHFAQRGVNGGIMVFLCSNLGNGPAGTQVCPPSGSQAAPTTIRGVFGPNDVIGPTGQGIGPGEYAEVLRAIRAGNAYVNVHSDLYPGGEIRGQLLFLPPDDEGD